MRWIMIVWWENAISTYENIFDDNRLLFLLHDRSFRLSIIFDLKNVSLIASCTALACWMFCLLRVSRRCLRRRISVRRQSSLMMMKALSVSKENRRDSFSAVRYETLNEYLFHQIDRAYMILLFFLKFWMIRAFYDSVSSRIDRFECFSWIIKLDHQFDNRMLAFCEH